MKQFIVNVKNECGFGLPRYKTQGSAGMDLYANIEKPVWIWPLCRKKIPTGLKIQLVNFMMADVRSRSGLASKYGIAVDSGVGTVDSDYRGEIFVPLANHSWWPFKVKPGMRIAQLIVTSYKRIEWNQVQNLDNTERGEGGFGSTGV